MRLDILRWEDGFYTAAHSFQEAIDAAIGNMTATDMVLCIVWKRAGLKLNPAIWHRADGSSYESGTVLEFETAVDVSRKHSGVPDVYLFRKTADVLYRADRANEEMEQYQLLQSVWKRWTESAEGYNTAGYQSFVDADDFEEKLEACLRQWLSAPRRGRDRPGLGPRAQGLAVPRAGGVRGGARGGVLRPRRGDRARHGKAAAGAVPAADRGQRLGQVVAAAGGPPAAGHRAGRHPRRRSVAHAIIVPSGDPLAQTRRGAVCREALGAELRAGDFSNAALLAELFAAGGKAALAPIRTALARAARRARRRCATRRRGRRGS